MVKMESNRRESFKTKNCQNEQVKGLPPVSDRNEIELKKKEICAYNLDIVEITSEFDCPERNSENVSIMIADFADSFAILFQDTSFHFDLSQIEDPLSLAKILKNSFNFACSYRVIPTKRSY